MQGYFPSLIIRWLLVTHALIHSSIDTIFQLPELSQFAVGLMHIQLLHTSASLAINENWDPDVRDDMEMMLNRIVPEDVPFRHSCEGPDDMVRTNMCIQYTQFLVQHICLFSACPCEGLLPGFQSNSASFRRQTESGHLARRLAVRASRPCRVAKDPRYRQWCPPGPW